jgi:hypothetical protein
MSKALANPKIFGAACLLFAAATLFNVSANASSSTATGMSLKAPISQSDTVLEVGPTIPPNPWEDDAPSVSSASSKM